jgi:hypothetical protein
MEMAGAAANSAAPRRTKSRSRWAAATARSTASTTAGAYRASSSKRVAAVATNMPLFQRWRPPATRVSAIAASGFSMKRATACTRARPGSSPPRSM